MIGAIVAGLVAGYGIAIPIGAVAPALVVLTARTSWRTGAAAALGIATADGGYALLAVLGGSALVNVVRPISEPLRWLAFLVLVVLAVRVGYVGIREFRRTGSTALAETDRSPSENRRTDRMSRPSAAYLGFLGITVLNPATIGYFAALIMGDPGSFTIPFEAGAFVLAAFVASASWQLLLVGGGVALSTALTGRRGRLVTALVSGVLIAALATGLLIFGAP